MKGARKRAIREKASEEITTGTYFNSSPLMTYYLYAKLIWPWKATWFNSWAKQQLNYLFLSTYNTVCYILQLLQQKRVRETGLRRESKEGYSSSFLLGTSRSRLSFSVLLYPCWIWPFQWRHRNNEAWLRALPFFLGCSTAALADEGDWIDISWSNIF